MPVHRSWTIRAIPVVVIILATILSLWRLTPPAHDTGGFSTAAAMEHVRFIASEPHPAGSPHNQAVREYLLQQFGRLGYDVHIQHGDGDIPVTNVLARKRGQSPGNRAVMLTAHYDSVRAGPGAGDDAAAVGALIEVAGIVAKQGFRNDIIFLITDGEEQGLLGARAFVAEHPWAAEIGAVLNFEARGTSGPSIMFETSADNGWLIDLFARHAPHPVCSSLTYDIYRRTPNDTDFTIFRRNGMKGLNFAFIGSHVNYHTPNDNAENLDQRSMRHHGVQALALLRALADLDVNAANSKPDAVYFDVLAMGVIRYPVTWAPFLAAVAAVIVVILVITAERMRVISSRALLASLGLLAVNVVGLWCLCWVCARMIGNSLRRYDDLVITGYAILACVVTASLFFLRRWTTPTNQAAAGLIIWVSIAVYLSFELPGGSYLALWPLVASSAAFGLALSGWLQRRRALFLVLLSITALPVAFLLPPIIYLSFLGLTVRFAAQLVILIVLGMWLLPLHINAPDPLDLPANA